MGTTSTFFVCATPRSGSTLLCEALGATGRAGRPREYFEALRGSDLPRQPQEYFDVLSSDVEELLPLTSGRPAPELARAGSYADYLDWVRERATTPNGVLGAKLMWGYLGELVGRLRELGLEGAGLLDVVEAAFPGARYVQVLRRDRIAQAVSLWTALQTQSWRAGGGEEREPAFHRGAIEHLAAQLAEHERAWTELLAVAGADRLVVVYEELVADWDPTLRRVLEFVGVPDAQTLALPPPPLERQSDGRSAAWVARFHLEVAGAAEADVA